MMEANRTGEPVLGHKGYSPFTDMFKNSIASMLACDVCHNLKVVFKAFINLLKGKRKAAPMNKPKHPDKLLEKYKGREHEIPQSKQNKLAQRLSQWDLQRQAQEHVNKVCVYACN
jgi:hypothetical protein